MPSLKPLLILTLCVGLLCAAPIAGAKPKKTTPQVKVFNMKLKSTKIVAPKALGEYFKSSSLVDADCGNGFLPLSIGISSATHPLASQDLGPAGMSVYASGAEGTAKTKLQALCVRGGSYPYYIGRPVQLGADGSGTVVKARLSCKNGHVALGAGLAHGHAPAFGTYRSIADGTRRWNYSAQIPSSVAAQLGASVSQIGYPRATCIKATGVKREEFVDEVLPSSKVQGTVTCKSGRVLGWGVELGASSSRSDSNGGWAIPTIERAQFVGSGSMSFTFARSSSGYSTATPVRAEVICGKLPRG